MSTISVPLNSETEVALQELTEITGANRSAVIRQAITRYREDEAITAVLRSEQEISEDKILRGNIDNLLATD